MQNHYYAKSVCLQRRPTRLDAVTLFRRLGEQYYVFEPVGCCGALRIAVSLNLERKITGVFAGDIIEAHRTGYEFVRRSAMQKVKSPFEIVVTTNSGYPLDLNLYQATKGMSA